MHEAFENFKLQNITENVIFQYFFFFLKHAQLH